MSTTTLLTPYAVLLPAPTVRFLCEAWWTCYSGARHTWRNRCDALLATGERLSVILPTTRRLLDIVVTPEAGWSGEVPSWYGVPCRLGRVALWLPVRENPGEYRPLSLLALLPKKDLEDAAPFVYLGAQFLVEHHVQVNLDCSSTTAFGQLVIPKD
jgi:hypothetical protein